MKKTGLNRQSISPGIPAIGLRSAFGNCALPSEGFVRIRQILAPHGPIPVSRSAWWSGVGDGRYPKSIKLGPRVTCWRVEDIRLLIERLSQSSDDA